MKKRKRILKWALAILGAAVVGVVWMNEKVIHDTDQLIYTTVQTVPHNRVALVLGTAPLMVGGQPNPFFERRMDAAASLFKAHRVDRLLLSGDNGTPNYDEPTAMHDALMARGIPESALRLDYAGFRTLDSIVRAHQVFGLEDLTIITDDFHLPRALFIARHEGIRAIGFQTRPLPVSVSPKTYMREIGSRTLMFLDLYVLHRGPKFLGHRESI